MFPDTVRYRTVSLPNNYHQAYCRLWPTFLPLTHSMVHSPPWEANWFAASQEIPRISRNPKVHYRTYKRPPPVSILGQPNPVHIPTSHLLEIRPNIIHPSTPRSPQWSLSLRFPHQDPIHPPLLTHTRHMPSPSPNSPYYSQRKMKVILNSIQCNKTENSRSLMLSYQNWILFFTVVTQLCKVT